MLLTAVGVCTRVSSEWHDVVDCSLTVKKRKCSVIGPEVGGGDAHLYIRFGEGLVLLHWLPLSQML